MVHQENTFVSCNVKKKKSELIPQLPQLTSPETGDFDSIVWSTSACMDLKKQTVTRVQRPPGTKITSFNQNESESFSLSGKRNDCYSLLVI